MSDKDEPIGFKCASCERMFYAGDAKIVPGGLHKKAGGKVCGPLEPIMVAKVPKGEGKHGA